MIWCWGLDGHVHKHLKGRSLCASPGTLLVWGLPCAAGAAGSCVLPFLPPTPFRCALLPPCR